MTDAAVPADPDSARALRDALGRFATGVTVVTMAGAQGPLGFTANSFAAVSLDPPLVLWSPARASRRFAAFAAAEHYSIHVMALDQAAICRQFARGGAGFEQPPPTTPEGVPVIAGALARFDCLRYAAHDGGDHLIIVGRVIRFCQRSGAPLVFSQGAYGGFVHGG